jgi:outer membrane protein
MKNVLIKCLLFGGLAFINLNVSAQVKIGYISLNDLIIAMPEAKQADSALEEFKQALAQNFQEFQKEFSDQNNIMNSKDTLKYTKSQLEIKKKNLQDLYLKLTNYKDDASQQFQKKQQELIEPIQQKAIKAIQDVAKENGYTCILAKEQVYAFPSADDVLAITKRKLGIK